MLVHAFLVLPFLAGAIAADVTITPPASVPDYASTPVPRNLISFGIAAHSFEEYAVQSSSSGPVPNTLTIRLLESLTNSTGVAPLIRVGGTSGDRATFLLNSEQPDHTIKIVKKPGFQLPFNITLNQRWFTQNFHKKNWPKGTMFIFDVPLARKDSLAVENMVRGAKWALDAITPARFQAFEVGNEPNLYAGQDFRRQNYTLDQYVKEWRNRAQVLRERVLQPKGLGGAQFQGLTFSKFDSWSVSKALNTDLNNGNFLQSVAEHDYPNDRNIAGSLNDSLMNHAAIVRNVSLAQGAVKAAMAHNISFANGEVGANIPGKDDLGLQHTLGSALWTIDYSLYSAFINIKHIHMQQAQGFAFAAWWPQNTKSNSNARSVRANFYGLKFVAEAMGTHTGPVRVASLDRVTGAAKTSDGRQQFVAYAIYESGKLARIVLVNMQIWLGDGTRPSSTVTLKVGGGFKSARYRVLTAAQGAREHTALKFGGVHWADSGLPSGTWSFKTQNVVNGTAKIQVGASEAALIDLIPA